MRRGLLLWSVGAVALGALVVAVMMSMSNDSPTTSPYPSQPTVDDLVARLHAAGLECTEREEEQMMGPRLTLEIESCQIREDQLTLYVFGTTAARDRWRHEVDVFATIVGPRWLAQLTSMKYATRVSEALGGRIDI